ncbi:hypothetical protein F5Y15DRAFT_267390 [Xylariaceae sp. FL0016]|nr:hypothetical protein F5Y15DRAFT_267390 [Xylariaceae sp. FL0016]
MDHYNIEAEWRSIDSGEEKKRLQNRMAQRRRRQKVKALQCEPVSKDELTVDSSMSLRHPPPNNQRATSHRRFSSTLHPDPVNEAVIGHSPAPEAGRSSPARGSATAPPLPHRVAYGEQPEAFDLATANPGQLSGDPLELTEVIGTFPAVQGLMAHSVPLQPDDAIDFLHLDPALDQGAGRSTQSMSWQSMDTGFNSDAASRSGSGGSGHNSLQSASTIEHGLEHILDSVFSAGFDSMEAMVVAYYTLSFDESSSISQAQRLSRKRHIRTLISALNDNCGRWSDDEARPLREEILNFAEGLYAAELQRLRSYRGFNKSKPIELLENLLLSRTEDEKESWIYHEVHREMPEIWSLFTKLVQQLGVLPSMSKNNTNDL